MIRQARVGQEVPIEPPRTARMLGADVGKSWAAPDAFEPLTGDDLAAWGSAFVTR